MGLVPGAMGHMAMECTAPHSMDLMPMEGSIPEGRAGAGLGLCLEILLPSANAYYDQNICKYTVYNLFLFCFVI